MYTAQNAQITTAIPDNKKFSLFFYLQYRMRDLIPWNVTPRYRGEVRPLLIEPPLFSNFHFLGPAQPAGYSNTDPHTKIFQCQLRKL